MSESRSPDTRELTAAPELDAVAREIEKHLAAHGARLTLGGEPTYVPDQPEGSEWNFVAVGPTKLRYAYAVAAALIERFLPGAVTIYSPGKMYPGEVNPRWVVNVLANRDGTPIAAPLSREPAGPVPRELLLLQADIEAALGLPAGSWTPARDSLDRRRPVAVLPLDHDGAAWITKPWRFLARRGLRLLGAEGPAGLRLPLNELPPDALRRALTMELRDGAIHLFLPPLLQAPFKELLGILIDRLGARKISSYFFEGYLPSDDEGSWTRVGLTADPGVLEVNMPPCETWAEYHRWLTIFERAGEEAGMRSWKQNAQGDPVGTGGGNHVLFGGPVVEENPFFTRPQWVASMLRYFQAHPSLSYLFTGSYVGASSQAPRPDESARDLYDLELAYQYLAARPPGDHRAVIGETLRHLHTDISGNTHRSEISFDKFWTTGGPAGSAAGLIEFRAVESLPRASWMSLVALLWKAVAVHTLDQPISRPLIEHGTNLHDRFFLPTPLWEDLLGVLADLRASGFDLPVEGLREIWQWRFPLMLRAEMDGGAVEVRRACESWPLLCEQPSEGGTTSRFVDASMERLEIAAHFAKPRRLFVNGRELALMPLDAAGRLMGCGLRYRRTALYPSLHPGIAPHLPLELGIASASGKLRTVYRLEDEKRRFVEAEAVEHPVDLRRPCAKARPTLLTYDLRLEPGQVK